MKWYLCPRCNRKLCRVDEKPKAGVFVWCKTCKAEIEVKQEATNELRAGNSNYQDTQRL